jgi:hypothetical protein
LTAATHCTTSMAAGPCPSSRASAAS